MDLTIFKTYNARVENGVVKRGAVIDDWEQYGLYYGEPRYLRVHEFTNWSLIVFDWEALGNFDPVEIGVPVLIYLPFGSEFRRAAVEGGFAPPDLNADEVASFVSDYKWRIDHIMITHGCAGVFWDESDLGYWDPTYAVASAQAMRDALEELCDHVRLRGGKSIVNGTPWFAKTGEYFLLESFVGSWGGNPFAPSWGYLPFFSEYGFSLDETGEPGGIPWTTGVFAFLYLWKYAFDGPNQTLQYGHAYGDPNSAWQEARQLSCYAAFRASGIRSFNFIDPTNLILKRLPVHRQYLGAPLETPQFDFSAGTIARRFSGGSVLYDDRDPDASAINLGIEADYWFDVHRPFAQIPWETVAVQPGAAWIEDRYVPDYMRITAARIWDDLESVCIRLDFIGAFNLTETLALFIYLQLDDALPGWQTSLQADGTVFMTFTDLKAHVYLFSAGLFVWEGSSPTDPAWRFLYQVEVKKSGTSMFWRIPKETLRYCVPSWDGQTIKWIPGFVGTPGAGFFIEGGLVVNPQVAPLLTVSGYLTSQTVAGQAFVPHNAAIFSGPSSPGNKLSQVTVNGSWQKAWLFDRENAAFIGPDGTPNTYFTSSPITPPKEIDASDIFVLTAWESDDPDEDGFAVNGVSVDLVPWAGSHAPAYDVGLPDLVAWRDLFEQWKERKLSTTTQQTFEPMGLKRGTIKYRKDTLKGDFVVTVQGTAAITALLDSTDIRGARIVLRRTFDDADFTDPDQTETLVAAHVDSWEFAEGELVIRARTNLNNWQSSFPRRRVSYFCPYVFKDARCAYVGPQNFCDKTLPACEGFGNEANFGGFPTIPRLQRGKWG